MTLPGQNSRILPGTANFLATLPDSNRNHNQNFWKKLRLMTNL
jgi:hypothetical protein